VSENESTGGGDPGFAPADLTDGRRPFQWESRWPPEAKKQIHKEALYVLTLFASIPVVTVLVANKTLGGVLGLTLHGYPQFETYSFSALGGLLGGVLFDLKWLYHAVARGTWNADRWLWRVFIPLISSGLAVAIVLLARSGTLPLVDVSSLNHNSTIMGVSFIIGYFSDNTIAAMARFASNVLGETHVAPRPSRNPGSPSARNADDAVDS